jgi:hypothetical protein
MQQLSPWGGTGGLGEIARASMPLFAVVNRPVMRLLPHTHMWHVRARGAPCPLMPSPTPWLAHHLVSRSIPAICFVMHGAVLYNFEFIRASVEEGRLANDWVSDPFVRLHKRYETWDYSWQVCGSQRCPLPLPLPLPTTTPPNPTQPCLFLQCCIALRHLLCPFPITRNPRILPPQKKTPAPLHGPDGRANTQRLWELHGVPAVHVPLGYADNLNPAAPPLSEAQKDIDVLFFGGSLLRPQCTTYRAVSYPHACTHTHTH